MVQKNKFNISINKNKIDFSINYGPFKISNKVLDSIKINSETLSIYPSYHGDSIVESLADFLNLKKENVIISNGSTEIFFLIPQVFKFNRALLLSPSFWEYEFTISLNSIKKDFLVLPHSNDFKFNRKEFEKKIKKVDCVYICYPNNPTSTYIEKGILAPLIKKYKNKMFIVDETYLLFFENYDKKTLNRLVTKCENLMIVSSLSKIFGIGGIRLGFCVSSKKNITLLKAKRNPYSLNIIAELTLPKILKDMDYLNKTRSFISKEKFRVYNEIKKVKWLKPFEPTANFILIKIKDNKRTLSKLEYYLERKGIKIRRGDVINGLSNKYFRICIKAKKENNLLVKALNEME